MYQSKVTAPYNGTGVDPLDCILWDEDGDEIPQLGDDPRRGIDLPWPYDIPPPFGPEHNDIEDIAQWMENNPQYFLNYRRGDF